MFGGKKEGGQWKKGTNDKLKWLDKKPLVSQIIMNQRMRWLTLDNDDRRETNKVNNN